MHARGAWKENENVSTLLCEVCGTNVMAPLRPFVRFYGYARRIPVMLYDGQRGPTVAERDGWTHEELDRRGLPSTGIDPRINARGMLDGPEFAFWAHPICCARADCLTGMIVAVRDAASGWGEDTASYAEPTGASLMRVERQP